MPRLHKGRNSEGIREEAMTPQEQKLIDELFERLASLENGPRDADAVRAINEGLQRAPNALYPLVQTALVQDEALKHADARIRELEGELGVEPGEPVQQTGFLDTMRDAILGKPQGSVPSVQPSAAPAARSPWRTTTVEPPGYAEPPGHAAQPGYAEPPGHAAQPGYAAQPGTGAQPPMPQSGGGSFLGTAAASAAGVVGGALLMNSFRGMFGGQHGGQSAFDSGKGAGTPWGSDSSGSGLARDAGLNDIGRGGRSADSSDGSQRAGLLDSSGDNNSDFDDAEVDGGGDFGGDDSA
jgi:hypothetical protein